MRAATAAAVAASVAPARRVTGTPSAATAAAVASDTTPGPPTMSTSPPRAWMSAATSGASDPAGVISRGAPIERASGAAATPAASDDVPASAGPVRTTVALLGAEIRPHSTEVAAGVAPATRLALAHGPQAPPGAGAMVRSEVTVATGVPSAATPFIRIVYVAGSTGAPAASLRSHVTEMGPGPVVAPVYVRTGVSEHGLRMSAVHVTARFASEVNVKSGLAPEVIVCAGRRRGGDHDVGVRGPHRPDRGQLGLQVLARARW